MRGSIIRSTIGLLALTATLFTMSGSSEAWYSPVNTWQQSAPEAAPGSLGQTKCLIQSMDGNIYGSAFAKAQAINSYCSTLQATVVYDSFSIGTSGRIVGCCYSVSQSTQAYSSVIGGYFSVTTHDQPLTLLTTTSVFP